MVYISRKCCFPWQRDAEEGWLDHMSQRGYQLTKPGLTKYEFSEGDGQKYKYRVLCMKYPASQPAGQAFIGSAEAKGAEYIGSASRWGYFRYPADLDGPELPSDIGTRLEFIAGCIKALRVLFFLFALLVIYELILMFSNRGYEDLFTAVFVLDAVALFIISRAYIKLRGSQSILQSKQ